MISLSKKFVLIIIFILVALGLLVESCVAPVTMPTNPILAPEIVSVDVHHNPVWNPPTYTTDPYSGETKEMYRGYWANQGTIEVTIKNRPFTPYTDKNGNYIYVYYSFFRNLYPEGWRSVPIHSVYQSDSEYTVATLTYSGYNQHLWVSWGQVVDIRVQAVTGHFDLSNMVFEGEGSEWTEFTVTIPASYKPGTSTPIKPSTSNPNSTPSQNLPLPKPSWTNIIILIVFVSIMAILLAVIAYQYKQRKAPLPTETDVFSCEVKTECLNKNKPCFTCCAAGVG